MMGKLRPRESAVPPCIMPKKRPETTGGHPEHFHLSPRGGGAPYHDPFRAGRTAYQPGSGSGNEQPFPRCGRIQCTCTAAGGDPEKAMMMKMMMLMMQKVEGGEDVDLNELIAGGAGNSQLTKIGKEREKNSAVSFGSNPNK